MKEHLRVDPDSKRRSTVVKFGGFCVVSDVWQQSDIVYARRAGTFECLV